MLLAISTHLDDAVLSCGDLLAANPGALVVTVMAGAPPRGPLTPWDAQCGFADGDDVVAARRAEDAAALAVIGARERWLEFVDGQYRIANPLADVVAALDAAVREAAPDRIVSPLGIGHDDHRLVAAAAWQVARRAELPWLVYLDQLYDDMEIDRAIATARDAGIELVPIASPAPGDARKRAAMDRYTSQRYGIPYWLEALRSERYWTVGRRAAAAIG